MGEHYYLTTGTGIHCQTVLVPYYLYTLTASVGRTLGYYTVHPTGTGKLGERYYGYTVHPKLGVKAGEHYYTVP